MSSTRTSLTGTHLGPERNSIIPKALQNSKADNFDFVEKMIQSNQIAWDNMVNNKFCKDMAKTKEGDHSMLGHFKWYMLQDMLYLKNYVYWKLCAFSNAPWDYVTSAPASIAGSIAFVTTMISDTLKGQLAIPGRTINAATPIADLKQYCDYLIASSKSDDWFSVHVAVVPCLLGYEAIANRLYADATIDKESLFYKLWIVPNHGDKSTKKYKEFLNAHYAEYKTPEREKHWQELFKQSCEFEHRFWNACSTNTL